MPKPYSMDLRLRVIAACDAGAGGRLGWLAWNKPARWIRARAIRGAVAPHREQVLRLLREHPDATIEELRTQSP